MIEEAYSISSNPQLVGVYTKAQSLATSADDGKKLPTILLFNSGLLPHVGPFRQYVRLAREFSRLGFNIFRFDLSGIGDSGRHNDNRSVQERHMGDIKTVMDFLQKQHDTDRYIAMGICTGGVNAHRVMVADKRVVGAVSIDGYYYPTVKYYFNLYAPKLLRLRSWRSLVKSFLLMLKDGFQPPRPALRNPAFDYRWELPPKHETEEEYKSFIARKVSLLCIFTGSWPYNYTNQLADAFKNIKFGEHIQVSYLENSDHIFPLAEDRENLTNTISDWLKARFGDHSSTA